ncbi:hypothetical protein AB0M57_23880 [Streptomyces sp. NPDC051597]|uniref:hypothetical protein n=1 Tax=Streptomyces sp. NPDC051597 TaxID=3155049 RepID=UPI00342F5C0D
MTERIRIPNVTRTRQLRGHSYRLDERRPAGEWYARQSEPVPAREVRGGAQVIGYATELARHRYDRWRVGRVLIRTNSDDVTRIEIGFYSEWVVWEGDASTPIPVYRR